MIIAITILITFCIAGLILLHPQKKAKKHQKIIIPLQELSTIWTKYNDDFMPAPESLILNDSLPQHDNVKKIVKDIPPEEAVTEKKAGGKEETINTDGQDVKPADVKKADSNSTDNSNDINTASFIPAPASPVTDFWNDCVTPYIKMFQEQKVLDIVIELIDILEKYGQCSSVVLDNSDSESDDLKSVRDNLAKVTVRDHSYSVARNLVEIVKGYYHNNPEAFIPKAVITGLAHDIGKIPELRMNNAFNTTEHHLISAGKLNTMLTGKEVFWARQAVSAIEAHHIQTKDDFANMLKRADREARQFEMLKFTPKFDIIKFESWFDIEGFYRIIESRLNYIQSYDQWEGFTFDRIIYCKPSFVFESAKKLCNDKKVIDLTFVYESDRDIALRKTVSILRKNNLIPDTLHHNFASRKFEVTTKIGYKQGLVLTPLKPLKTTNLVEIEKRKQDYLLIIRSVRAVGR